MDGLNLSGGALLAFALASLVLAATPGPGVLYVVARTLAQGRRAGLASVAGVACGNLGNAVGASLGLAALFALSSLAFAAVKYAGAAYLVWLGVQALRRPRAAADNAQPDAPQFAAPDPRRIFRDGFLVALLNPKTAIFFAAFLPQFLGQAASAGQGVLLGALFVAIAACTDGLYVLAAALFAQRFAGAMGRAAGAGRYASATTFIGLGVWTAVAGSHRPAS